VRVDERAGSRLLNYVKLLVRVGASGRGLNIEHILGLAGCLTVSNHATFKLGR